MTLKSYLAKMLWLNLIDEHLNEYIQLANKLKRVKFAHGKTRQDKYYEYARKHFPSLLKKYEIDSIDIGFDLQERESPDPMISGDSNGVSNEEKIHK